MDINEIVQISNKEKKLKEKLEKILESKKKQLNSIDQYRSLEMEKAKKYLAEYEVETEKKIKANIEKQTEDINNETKQLIKHYSILDPDLKKKAIDYIIEEFFK